METKIHKTLIQWFPDAFVDFNESVTGNSDYGVLRHFARYTQKLIQQNSDKKKEPFNIINLLYFKSTRYEKNAIENEFFSALAIEEKPKTLKEHLELMPESLRSVYIQIILEN